MRKPLKTSILVFAFCFCAFAQTEEKSSCPIISIYGPAGIVNPNDSAKYSVEVDTKGKDLKLEYIWHISAGEILQGQNSKSLIVKQPNSNLTVTVEVKGIAEEYENIATEVSYGDPLPQAEKIDEFSQSFIKINKNRIDKIVRVLHNDPNAHLYIIFKHKEKTSPKITGQKEREISNSLVKAGLVADRITAVTDFGQRDLVEFWLVPAGATPPKVENN
jgi:hypothetical protein